MALVPINWTPDRTTLRQFAEFGMFVLGMVLAPLALWRGQTPAAIAFWVAAVVLRGVGLARPSWLRPVFVGLTALTWPIGWVVSHAALALTYYLVITPMALVFRIVGRDALQRRSNRRSATYWEAYDPDRGLERYLRQF
jgi:hypothetical protein